jgi:beta-lactamase regulating signal transducer with metallopeptidase domain
MEFDWPAWGPEPAGELAPGAAGALHTGAVSQDGPFAEPRVQGALLAPATDLELAFDAPPPGRHVAPVVIALWLAGALLVLAPLLRGLGALWRLQRRAPRGTRATWTEELARLGAEGRVERELRFVVDGSLRVPMVWGGLPGVAPFIALPSAAEAWERERVRSTLLHELAHLERRDGSLRVLTRMALALSWPIPLAWSAWRRLLVESERACDDLVLAAGEKASTYAAHLLAVAAGASREEPWPLAPALVHTNGLEGRLRALLASDRNRNRPSTMFKLSSALLALVALLGLGSFAGLSRDSGAPADAAESAGVDVPRSPGGEALQRGLDYLLSVQDEESGAWVGTLGYKLNNGFQPLSKDVPHVGLTALALRALLVSGARPDEGASGRALRRGTRFLLDAMATDPGFIQAHGSRMTSHGLALEYLAELCAATGDATLRERVQPAVDFTIRTRIKSGWRYRQFSEDSDLLNTGIQTVALQAARDAGLAVPQSTLNFVLALVLEHRAPEEDPRHGQFRYQVAPNARCTPATTGAGLLALAGSEVLDEAFLGVALPALTSGLRQREASLPQHYLTWHARFFGLRALRAWATNEARLELYEDYRGELWRALLKSQQADGSWEISVGPGKVYSTAVACLLLQG